MMAKYWDAQTHSNCILFTCSFYNITGYRIFIDFNRDFCVIYNVISKPNDSIPPFAYLRNQLISIIE